MSKNKRPSKSQPNNAPRPANVLPQATQLGTDTNSTKKRRWWLIPEVIIVGILVPVVLFLLGRDDKGCNPLGMLCTPIATATPIPRMPDGKFNVIVAGFGTQDLSGHVTASEQADGISQTIYTEIANLKGTVIDNLYGPTENGIDRILGQTTQERYNLAATLAKKFGAGVVVYGTIREDGGMISIEPSFYLEGLFPTIEPELLHDASMQMPLDLLQGGVSEELSIIPDRVAVIRYFVEGLNAYIEGSFAHSRSIFETAIAEEPNISVLYIYAGNAALREPSPIRALELFNAIASNPNDLIRARALIGLGKAYFTLADEARQRYEPGATLGRMTCSNSETELPSDSLILALLALDCYDQALDSVEDASRGDIDVKAAFGRAQVWYWLTNRGANAWDNVQTYAQAVIDLYNAADERRNRLHFYAGHAYAWLGAAYTEAQQPRSVEGALKAKDSYNQAQFVLTQDITNAVYNSTPMAIYAERIEGLDIWLGDHMTPTPP